MSFTHEIKEVLREYDGVLFKMIEVKVTNDTERFSQMGTSLVLTISDGANTASGFILELSGNQKELLCYFTVDAFSGFASSSDIIFGYFPFSDEYTIPGVDVTSITPLPTNLSLVSYQTADNAWLATL